MLTCDDYYPAPFWFLNHKLEKEEIIRQLDLMRAQGIKAFFLHPRAGLKTPYASREWFDLMRFAALEADKRHMKAWLYDEDPFPSGPAGGRIFLDHPEYAARQLVFHEHPPDASNQIRVNLGEARLLEAYLVRTDVQGNVLEKRDVFDDVGMIRDDFFRTLWPSPYYHHLFGKETYNHYRAETFYPHLEIDVTAPGAEWKLFAVTAATIDCTKYRHIPDNLNPECVREFIRLTHEQYKKYMGDLFGKVIPGIFTDETATGGPISWTPRMAEEFAARRGYELSGRCHEIFKGDSEKARSLRRDYWITVQELFIECFFKPVNDWCNENRLLLCGHGIGEEMPTATTNGMNIFALQKYVGIPGFDHITPNIPNWSNFTSLNLGGKLVASAAEQNGVHRVQSECFGCNAYNFGHDGMKKNMYWLYSLGVNWLVPHGFHYSYDGFRKDDAGKSFFFQSPDYDAFHEFGRCAARLGFKLGESRSTAQVCVVYPENEFRRLVPAENSAALECAEALYRTVQTLLMRQIPFELADEATLSQAEVRDGKVLCGRQSYAVLLLPFPLERDYLERFRRAGVKVTEDSGGLESANVLTVCSGATREPLQTMMTQVRRNDQGYILYVFNNNDTEKRITLAGGEALHAYIYDASTDELQAWDRTDAVAIAAYGAVLIELRNAPVEACRFKQALPLPAPDFAYMTQPQWDYIPKLDNLVAVLADYQIQLGEKDFGVHHYNLIREIAGSAAACPKRVGSRAIFDRAPDAPSQYPAPLWYRAKFHLPSPRPLQLILESESIAGQAEIRINGHRLKEFTRCKVYDPWNLAADTPEVFAGDNTIEIFWPEASEYDGLTSLLYLAAKTF